MSAEIKLDLGSVKVHKHVLEEIIANSISEIPGVRLVGSKFADTLRAIFNGPSHAGVRIRIDESHEILLDLTVNVTHGARIPDVGRQIQDIVKQDIKKALDIGVKDINVDIKGIERG